MGTDLTLVVDTSILGASLGIVANLATANQKIWTGHYLGRDGSAKSLNSLVSQGIEELNATRTDVKRFVVSTGPGSFTGIKVGLSWVYGSASGQSTAPTFWAMSSLVEAAAYCSRRRGGSPVGLLIGSTKTHGYLAVAASGTATASCDLLNLDLERDRQLLITRLQGASSLILGNDWAGFSIAEHLVNVRCERYDSEQLATSAVNGMIERASSGGINSFTAALPTPNYMRLSTAEEKLMAAAEQAKHQVAKTQGADSERY